MNREIRTIRERLYFDANLAPNAHSRARVDPNLNVHSRVPTDADLDVFSEVEIETDMNASSQEEMNPDLNLHSEEHENSEEQDAQAQVSEEHHQQAYDSLEQQLVCQATDQLIVGCGNSTTMNVALEKEEEEPDLIIISDSETNDSSDVYVFDDALDGLNF